MPDPVRDLLRAAAGAARHIGCRDRAVRVVVYCSDNLKVLDLHVPHDALDGAADGRACAEVREVVPGWSFERRQAFFDGKAVAVSASRVGLLKVLAEAAGPLTAKELAKAAFGDHGDEESARFHVRELRKELKSHFDYEADPVPNEGGYRLALR